MGGLVVRAYIQSGSYDDDIDKFAMVGTPNHGAANAYFIWEGGDPKLADDLNDLYLPAIQYLKRFIDFYSTTLNRLYENMNENESFSQYAHAGSTPAVIYQPNPEEVRNFVQNKVQSVGQLLPTYGFLCQGMSCSDPIKGIDDTWLKELNDKLNMKGVNALIWAGIGENTIEKIKVGKPNNLYKDGQPLGWLLLGLEPAVPSTSGDGTVLRSSVSLQGVTVLQDFGEHSSLIDTYKADLVQFVTGKRPSEAVLKALEANSRADSGTNEVNIATHGRVRPYITDPLGRSSGITPANDFVREIPDSQVYVDNYAGSITFKDAMDGTYTLSLKSSYSEDYRLSISYIDAGKAVEHDYWGFNHGNAITCHRQYGWEPCVVVENEPMYGDMRRPLM